MALDFTKNKFLLNQILFRPYMSYNNHLIENHLIDDHITRSNRRFFNVLFSLRLEGKKTLK